jgi:hypothetical protein
VIKLPSASKRTIILLSGCLLARAWAALTATSLGDLNVITRQTKESKRVGEILEGLKLGGANSEGSSDTIDVDSIPDTLSNKQVDTKTGFACRLFCPLFQQFLALVCCHKSFWQNS